MAFTQVPPSAFGGIPFETRCSMGRWGSRFIAGNKFANNPALGTSYEEIWNVGGFESYLSSAEVMEITSTDAADAAAGTGARTLQVYGLDNNYRMIDEIVTLNGTSAVDTTQSYLRVYRMIVRSAGSGAANAGTIDATAKSAGSVHARITIGDNQTLKSQYTVPDGYYIIIEDLEAGVFRNDDWQVRLVVREEGEVFAVKRQIEIFGSPYRSDFLPPLIYPPRSDLALQGVNNGAGTIAISGSYDFILVRAEDVNT